MILALLLLGTAAGQAVPRPWKQVDEKLPAGLALYSMAIDQPLKAWLVVADLGRPDLEFRPLVSKHRHGKESVSSLAKAAGAIVAVNASYFKMRARPCQVVGWLVVDGQQLAAATSIGVHRKVSFNVARAALIWKRGGGLRMSWVRERAGRTIELERPIPNRDLEPARGKRANPEGRSISDVLHAVGAGPMLIRNGEVKVTNDEELLFAGRDDRHPRTVVGTDGKKLYLMVVDGRQRGVSRGSTLLQCGRLLKAWGVASAMNLDGGGSSTLIVNKRLINLPVGRKLERAVPTALAILPRRR